jgi:hypothetical protein
LECRCVPATITPTTLADGGRGSGSLRDAILMFNADTGIGDDIIQLQSGTYALTLRNLGGVHETDGLTGDLNLTQASHHWIIQGAGSSGATATIIDAGQLQDRVFEIVTPGTQVVLRDLVIRGGLAQDDGSNGALAGTTNALGGGILNNGGDVTLDNVVLQNNVARGGGGGTGRSGYNARGGALYSSGGTVTIADSTIANDQATGGFGGSAHYPIPAGAGGEAQGGGLYALGGALTISNSTVSGNAVYGGHGGLYIETGCISGCVFGSNGGTSQGGGLYVGGGALTVTNSTITANAVQGGDAFGFGGGGASQGGGLYANGTVTISDAMIAANTLRAGDGRAAGVCQGGGLYTGSGNVTVSDVMITANTLHGGDGLVGGATQGGGLYAGSATLMVRNSTISANTLQGGPGAYDLFGSGAGGNAQGGGLYTLGGAQTISHSTLANNQATGGPGGQGGLASGSFFIPGGAGGNAQGGGLYATGGLLTFEDSTAAGNSVRGGDGGSGGQLGGDGGAGEGGGLWVSVGATVQVSFSTIANSHATGGTHGHGLPDGHDGPATGGGLYDQGMLQTSDTILAGNTVTGAGTNTSPDLFGNLGSLGYNLIGNSQGGSGFDPSDLLDVDPLLGPLQYNGGPTQTMALRPGSPALNAGDPNQLGTTDQRGVVRSGGVNIGAYQASASALLLTAPVTVQAGVPFNIAVQAVDPFGQTAVGYRGRMHFVVSNGAMAEYTFTATDAGQHTFSNLVLRQAGTLTVTGTDTADASLTGSTTFTITPAAADHLVFRQQPSDTAAGQTIHPAVMVAVVDQFGNIETGDNSDMVTLSLGTNPGGGTLGGTLTVPMVNGVATFSDLSIDQAGVGYTLHASVGGGLGDIDSNAFNVTM